jgi:hypothetical protein
VETETTLEDLILAIELKIKIQNLRRNNITPVKNSASVAFLAGFILKKLDDKFHCDECLSPLLATTTTPGPLLRLIAFQNRGGLTYPSANFVGIIIKEIADLIEKLLPLLTYEKTCQQLVEILYPPLQENELFNCLPHKNDVCRQFVIKAKAKPALNNICLERTDLLKKKSS